MRSSVLVAGASGFIGRHLARHFITEGRTVIAGVRNPDQALKQTAGLAGAIHVDASLGAQGLDGLRLPVDCTIINCAAYGVAPSDRDFGMMHEINAVFPVALAHTAAKSGARVIHLGSCSEYAAEGLASPVAEDGVLESRKLYGATKASGGVMFGLAARSLGLPAVVLRLFNVYGPGESTHRLLPMLERLLRSEERVPLSAGTQIRDFILAQDVAGAVSAAIDALEKDEIGGGDAFNIATGRGASVAQFARTAARALGANESLLGFSDLPLRQDDVGYIVGDPEKFAAATGWRAQFDLDKGVAFALSEGQNQGNDLQGHG